MDKAVDYTKIGLKVGLEIHQELATKYKLFCGCSPSLFKDKAEHTFVRRLRPTQSELGQVDAAALFEFRQGKRIQYETSDGTDCLVEMDEEPPASLNAEAVDTCIMLAHMISARPLDEIHVMRKIVIDGSNTTGFQRTCVVALGGDVVVGDKRVGIQQVSLEEDAARKTEGSTDVVKYRIDRLGIPLIEVSTEPEIHSPEEARETAQVIGRLLRSTRRVRRGLGTIRQDINVSIRDGALVEIKGLQQLELVSKVVEFEVMRQRSLIQVRDELARRAVTPVDLPHEFHDVTGFFKNTECRILASSVKKGEVVLASILPKFAGVLGHEICPGRRVGTEMADRARFWGRVAGLFHSDELPAYGISLQDVNAVRSSLKASSGDALVIVSGPAERCRDALEAVRDRACEAIQGVPPETRGPNADGTTSYMRPRPGAARMYPETDVLPTTLDEHRLEAIKKAIPETLEALQSRMMKQFGLNSKLAKQVAESEYFDIFENIVQNSRVPPSIVAATLTETLRSLERESISVSLLSEEQLKEVFSFLDEGRIVKESLPELLSWMATNQGSTGNAVKALGVELLSDSQIAEIAAVKVAQNEDLVKKLGDKSVGPLMGMVMNEVRGKAEAQKVQRILSETIKKRLQAH